MKLSAQMFEEFGIAMRQLSCPKIRLT